MQLFETNFMSMIFAAAACEDCRRGMIPNHLILTGAATGTIRALFTYGIRGMFCCILRAALVGVFFYIFFMLKGLGAGDVKLLAMTGIWIDPGGVLTIVFVAFIAALLFALTAVVRKAAEDMFCGCVGKRNAGEKRGLKGVFKNPVKLAPAVLIGWVAYLGGINFV